jgi:dienelactone hydrolase
MANSACIANICLIGGSVLYHTCLSRARRLGLCAFVGLVTGGCVHSVQTATSAKPRLEVATIVSGQTPSVSVSGLAPRAAVRIASLRAFEVWTNEDANGWKPKTIPLVGWADVNADAQGRIDMTTANIRSGSWTGIDPYGLFWSVRKLSYSGIPAGLEDLVAAQTAKRGETRLFLIAGDSVTATATATFAEPPNLKIEAVSIGALNGVFAAPEGARGAPAVILLHGSEGGDAASARALAVRFAGQGFAAFALNYFAWDMSGIETISNVHINIPIERIAEVRAWLAQQTEADVTRLGVYGHSKGAEFAAVAAVRYPWIKAVAACVPSDVVWEGYGIGDPRAQRLRREPDPAVRSSWSWQGEPLPYVPLRPYVDANAAYFDNTERYDRSRNDDPVAARRAIIAIEQSPAAFLLIGGGKDEVWASGRMADALAARLRAANRPDDAAALVFADAGHGICGDGTYPPNVWSEDSADPRVKDLNAEGKAAVTSWQATASFFKRVLNR